LNIKKYVCIVGRLWSVLTASQQHTIKYDWLFFVFSHKSCSCRWLDSLCNPLTVALHSLCHNYISLLDSLVSPWELK
jgi:hypothetical protein